MGRRGAEPSSRGPLPSRARGMRGRRPGAAFPRTARPSAVPSPPTHRPGSAGAPDPELRVGRGKRFERGKRKFPLKGRRCALALIHGAPAAAGRSFYQLTDGRHCTFFLPESACHVSTHPRAQPGSWSTTSPALTALVRPLWWWRPPRRLWTAPRWEPGK